MTERATGGCLCGTVRYAYAGDIDAAGYCHCEDCRRCTGSAFNISVGLALAQFTITAGTPKGYIRTADSGHELTRYFCPDCGSPLYTASPRHPDTIYVKAGSLDDPSLVRPGHQNWTSRTVPWSVLDPALPAFEKGRP